MDPFNFRPGARNEMRMKYSSEPKIVFCSGGEAPLNMNFIRELLLSLRFKLFFVMSIGLFALIQPYQPVSPERWQAITIIAVVGLSVIAFYLGIILMFTKLSQRLSLSQLPTFWVLLISSLMASFAGQWALLLFGEAPKSVFDTLLIWVFHFYMFVSLEIAFSALVLPEIIANLPCSKSINESTDREPSTIQSPFSDASSIIIAGNRFRPQTIKWVRAEEHYISISTFDGKTFFLRARLRDFLAQVSEDLGFSIHRSYWVAWIAISQVEVAKDSITVVLDEGTAWPVARGRRSEFVKEWKQRVLISTEK